jgi:hypothetical protein
MQDIKITHTKIKEKLACDRKLWQFFPATQLIASVCYIYCYSNNYVFRRTPSASLPFRRPDHLVRAADAAFLGVLVWQRRHDLLFLHGHPHPGAARVLTGAA